MKPEVYASDFPIIINRASNNEYISYSQMDFLHILIQSSSHILIYI